MRQFTRAVGIAVLPLAMITAAPAAEFSAKDLAAEEGKFAAYSVKHGMRAAFLEFFAAQSWLLRPEPVDAIAWVRGRPDPAIVLNWKSHLAVRSASGDLGMSTGPTIFHSKADPAAPAAHGEFFSVWQKQANGDWKVFIDHGISHGPTATPNKLSEAPVIAIDLVAQASLTAGADDEAEQRFAASGIAGYAEVITPRTRLLREGRHPIDGVVAIGEFLKSQSGQWTWTMKIKGASRANDFAYALGNYTWLSPEGVAQKGQFVRVWVREAGGAAARWTLAGEVLTPAPPPKS